MFWKQAVATGGKRIGSLTRRNAGFLANPQPTATSRKLRTRLTSRRSQVRALHRPYRSSRKRQSRSTCCFPPERKPTRVAGGLLRRL